MSFLLTSYNSAPPPLNSSLSPTDPVDIPNVAASLISFSALLVVLEDGGLEGGELEEEEEGLEEEEMEGGLGRDLVEGTL